jgi:4-hydroxy-4-methyl-2-oxoglutarate aldolase
VAAFDRSTFGRARRLGTATLHEASGRRGALPAAIKPVESEMFLCGRAFTVQCPPLSNLQIHHAIYLAGSGDILVVHVGGATEAGYWGDILNEAAISRGLGGLVIDGGVRDTAGLSRKPFPVFSNGICIRGTSKDHDAVGWLQEPVQLGEVIVQPGDLVVGDRDGVVVLPASEMASIFLAAEVREAEEARKIALIRDGARTIDLYGFSEGAPKTITRGTPFRGRV